jgi:iron-sulfur cluster repair protein YtfE (RIC family)
MGPRAVLDAVVKRKIPSPRWESNPRTPIVQSVAQRYHGFHVDDEKNKFIIGRVVTK